MAKLFKKIAIVITKFVYELAMTIAAHAIIVVAI